MDFGLSCEILYFCRMKRILLIFTLLFLSMTGMAQDYKAMPGMNTGALQSLIDKASNRGGGRVTFSRGRYLIGPLELKNGVELHLEEGACLLGSTSPYDYAPVDAGKVAGDRLKDTSHRGLIVAKNVKNLSFFQL